MKLFLALVIPGPFSALFLLNEAGLSNTQTIIVSGIISFLIASVPVWLQVRDRRQQRSEEKDKEEILHLSGFSDKVLEKVDAKEARVIASYQHIIVEIDGMYKKQIALMEEQHKSELESMSKIICAKDELNKQQESLIKQVQELVKGLQK